MSRTLIPLTLFALVGCKAVDADPELTRFESCDALDDYMRSVAKTEAKYDWSWSFDGVGFGTTEMAMASADAGGEAAPTDSASSYSTTNTQEADVDEDDLVKTDGTWMYALSGDALVISKAWPITEAAQVSVTEIDGTATGLYLMGDVVVAISQSWSWDGDANVAPRSGASWDRENVGITIVTVIDVSDRTAPVVERETYTSGELQTTRRIGDMLYVVTYEDVDVVGVVDSYSEAKSRIKDAEVADWLPRRLDNVRSGSDWEVSRGEACDCDKVWASDAESGTYTTNVLSLDLSDPLADFQGESVVGRADTVYASSAGVYVAWSEWSSGAFPTTDTRIDTILHRFDIAGQDAVPAYDGTAKFSGSLVDQFALSEHEGVMRVAATELEDDTSSSVIYTFQAGNGQLEELDSLDGLAPDESIFAARFVGDIGYIVTYEQMLGDPLFTFDLSDPSNIRQAGELAVTGWSDYIHPMDQDHLLTLGYDEDASTGEWALAVSIFDVSDLDAPSLQDRLLLDASWSEASDEHHAFNYFADSNVLAIPSWDLDGQPVLEVIHANPDEALASNGQVSQDALMAALGDDSWCGAVRRSVVMEDYVYSVSAAGLVAAEIADPSNVLSTVAYEGTEPCESSYYGW